MKMCEHTKLRKYNVHAGTLEPKDTAVHIPRPECHTMGPPCVVHGGPVSLEDEGVQSHVPNALQGQQQALLQGPIPRAHHLKGLPSLGRHFGEAAQAPLHAQQHADDVQAPGVGTAGSKTEQFPQTISEHPHMWLRGMK